MATPQVFELPATVIPLAGGATPKVAMGPYTSVSFQFNFDADGGDAAGNVFLESSNDGVNFNKYPDSTLGFNNTTPSHLLEVRIYKTKYIRAVVEKTSGTGGTCSVLPYFTTNME